MSTLKETYENLYWNLTTQARFLHEINTDYIEDWNRDGTFFENLGQIIETLYGKTTDSYKQFQATFKHNRHLLALLNVYRYLSQRLPATYQHNEYILGRCLNFLGNMDTDSIYFLNKHLEDLYQDLKRKGENNEY